MANNLRTIKKDIDFLADEVISDCFSFMSVNPEAEDKVFEIIDEVVEFRNNLYDRVNNVQENPVKPYFRAIKADLLSGFDGFYEKLSAMVKKEN